MVGPFMARTPSSKPAGSLPPAAARPNRWLGLIVIALAIGLIITAIAWKFNSRGASSSASTRESPPAADRTAKFEPTMENKSPVPADVPAGMAWVPGGEFSMGAQEAESMNDVGMQATLDSRPVHRVYVDGFWMDKTDVTNAEFERFVKATRYVTVAERKPRAEDFPGAPPENLVAGAVVFSPPDHMVPLNDHLQWWSYVPGANWRHPEGPQTSLKGREKFPVVDIAYEDAAAYAKWGGKSVPTVAEWEV